MLHLYALTTGSPGPPPDRGIERCAIDVVSTGPFDAVVSKHDRRPSPTADAIVAHARVVDYLVPRTPTLPVRFGSSHTDVTVLSETVTSDQDALMGALRLVDGHVEFAARAARRLSEPHASGEPAPVDAHSARTPVDKRVGRAYLERQAELLHARDRKARREWGVLDEATSPLVACSSGVRTMVGRAGRERCFLVAVKRIAEFERAARHIERSGVVTVDGPWAAFSFVTGETP